MNYGIILASGKGTRMKNARLPKQFELINERPIISYTLSAFLSCELYGKVIVVLLDEYREAFAAVFDKYFSAASVEVVTGGDSRMASIDNAVDYIVKNYGAGSDDVIVIHDAVRPFVSQRILTESVTETQKYKACVCGLPVADTMLVSKDGKVVSDIPDRSTIFSGQSPDSFLLTHYLKMRSSLSPERLKRVTGTSQICSMNGFPVHIIAGDYYNFKITTDIDLKIAEAVAFSAVEEG